MKRIFLFLIFVGLFSSCVSKKRLTYLQDSEGTVEIDTSYYRIQRKLYRVQPNDILSISIKSFDDEISARFNASLNPGQAGNLGDLIFYLNGIQVNFNGEIEMPVIGLVNVSGKSTEEIKALLTTILQDYFKDEAVYVSVQLSGIRFSIIGDVNTPGKYVAYQNQLNIFEALAMAGDITVVGDRKKVQIIRQEVGGLRTIELDLTSKNVLSSKDFFVQPNDIINIKPLAVKSLGIGTSGFETFASILGVLASTATLIFTISRIN